jgi:hypothetical protein
MATRTWGEVESGTPGPVVLIVNQNGLDVVHRTLKQPRPSQQELITGKGSFAELHQQWFLGTVSVDELTDSSVRVGIRTDEAWRPRSVFVWGSALPDVSPLRFSVGNLYPLAFETGIETVLSTDPADGDGEARISMPLRRTARGSDFTTIRSVLAIITTAGVPVVGAGTTSRVDIQLRGEGGGVLAEWTIADGNNNPPRLASGRADVLRFPLEAPITRAQLRSVTLMLRGNDAWVLQDLFLFGLDTATDRPGLVVPLGYRNGDTLLSRDDNILDWKPVGLRP